MLVFRHAEATARLQHTVMRLDALLPALPGEGALQTKLRRLQTGASTAPHQTGHGQSTSCLRGPWTCALGYPLHVQDAGGLHL